MYPINRVINASIIGGILIVLGAVLLSCQNSKTENLRDGENEKVNPDYSSIPLLIGTRGKFHPEDHEHTISSLTKSPPWVDGVYINIRVTSDNVPVLMHDSRVDRTTDGSGTVKSMTLKQIKSLNAGDGARVPTLKEYLQAILNREESLGRRPFSRIFLNPRDESIEAISKMYSVATTPEFESLVERYTWQFNNLLNSDSGATNIRALDDTAAIGTFLSEVNNVVDMINSLEGVNGETILLWPQEYDPAPETLQKISENGFEAGVSRVGPKNLQVIPMAHEDPNVKVLFTWYAHELSWWYPESE